MAGSNSTDGQRSERFVEFLQNTPPQVVPSLKRGKEGEELRRKRLARMTLQEARAVAVYSDGSHHPEEYTQADVEMSEPGADQTPLSPVSGHEPARFVVELATVGMHEDLDHPMPNAPALTSVAAGVPSGVKQVEVVDEAMPDAPELVSVTASVPGPEQDDVIMEDAPPLSPAEEMTRI